MIEMILGLTLAVIPLMLVMVLLVILRGRETQ